MANRRCELLVVCFSLCLLVAGQAEQSRAQILATQPVSAEALDRLLKELAQDVAALERQGNILKRVVSLTQPTVVHIDAKKAEDAFCRRAV